MLPRERIITTLAHREPDRVPWGEHSIDYAVYEMVLGRESFVQGKFKLNQALWEGRRDEVVAQSKRDIVDLARALEFDLISVGMCPPKGAQPTPMEQVDCETYRDAAGNLYRISATTHDLMLIRRADTTPAPPPTVEQLQEQIDRIDAEGVPRPDDSVWEVARHVMDTLQGTHWININVGDVGFPVFGHNQDEQFLNLALYPHLHEKLAEMQAKAVIAMIPYYAEQGFDSIMPCGDLGSSTALLANPAILEKHVVKWWKKYVETAREHGLRVFKHCCGCIWEALPWFPEVGYEVYEGIQASAGMDMKLLKEQYGDRLTFWGGVTNEKLILGTPDEVRADAAYALQWGAPGGGFIYGASHSLAMGTTFENLMTMKQMRDEYGVYPICVPQQCMP